MCRLLITLLVSVGLGFTAISEAHADEFPWFTVDEREGILEWPPKPNAQSAIYVMPRFGAPRNACGIHVEQYRPHVRDVPGGAVSVAFEIDATSPSDGNKLLMQALDAVILEHPSHNQQVDAAARRIQIARNISYQEARLEAIAAAYLGHVSTYQLRALRPRSLDVDLLVGGQVIGSYETGSGFVSARYTGEIRYDGANEELKDRLRAGDFRLRATYVFPFATFSSVSIDIEQEALSRSRTEAFREVVKRSVNSSQRFLFVNVVRRTYQEYTKEWNHTTSSEDLNRRVDMISRDPEEAQLQAARAFLGFAESSWDTFQANHRAAAARVQSINPALAELHIEYVEALAGNNAQQQARVLAAIAALSKKDLAGFIANGFAAYASSTATQQTYYGVSTSAVSSQERHQFHDVLIRTAQMEMTTASGPFPEVAQQRSLLAQHRLWALFGTPTPSAERAGQALVRAVRHGQASDAEFILRETQPSFAMFEGGRTALMWAAQRGRSRLVRLLIRAGADPTLQNGSGDRASDFARVNGHDAIARFLEEREQAVYLRKLTFVPDRGRIVRTVVEFRGKRYEHDSDSVYLGRLPAASYRAHVWAVIEVELSRQEEHTMLANTPSFAGAQRYELVRRLSNGRAVYHVMTGHHLHAYGFRVRRAGRLNVDVPVRFNLLAGVAEVDAGAVVGPGMFSSGTPQPLVHNMLPCDR